MQLKTYFAEQQYHLFSEDRFELTSIYMAPPAEKNNIILSLNPICLRNFWNKEIHYGAM